MASVPRQRVRVAASTSAGPRMHAVAGKVLLSSRCPEGPESGGNEGRTGGADVGPPVRAVPYTHLSSGGSSTASMTWITPFLQTMSVFITFAPLTVTLPSLATILIDLPWTVLADVELDHVGGHDLAGDDVVGQDGRERLLVLEQGVELLLGDLGERLVRRGEDGERALALERLDQARPP